MPVGKPLRGSLLQAHTWDSAVSALLLHRPGQLSESQQQESHVVCKRSKNTHLGFLSPPALSDNPTTPIQVRCGGIRRKNLPTPGQVEPAPVGELLNTPSPASPASDAAPSRLPLSVMNQ